MKIAFVIYRQWAFDIYKKINKSVDVLLITNKKNEFSLSDIRQETPVYKVESNQQIYNILKENQVDVVLFYGWSWIVENIILKNFLCLGLHPSPLPKYRGGTPIQHQLLNREKTSAVTIFKMNQGIDNGDIYMQLPMPLSGTVKDIFKRMTNLGTNITNTFIKDYKEGLLNFKPQKNINKYKVFKRRKPQESEIKVSQLKEMNFEDLHNFVRGLLDPFPNAYILLKEKKIKILKIKRVKNMNAKENIINSEEGIFLRLKDGFAKIIDYKIEKN